MAYYRTAKPEDCEALADRLREQDKQEVWDAGHLKPLEALTESLKESSDCFAIIDDNGEIVGLFGVSDKGEMGIPWLLGAEGIKEIARPFLKQGKMIVQNWSQRFPLLMNYVAADNTVAIVWLSWLGFQFTRMIPDYGVEKKPFFEFVRIRDV